MHRSIVCAAAVLLGSVVLAAGQNPTMLGHPEDYPRVEVAHGSRLYAEHCDRCHGADGNGVGHDTWEPCPPNPATYCDPEGWKHGGGSVWVTGSYDPALNLTYWGIGNVGPDYNADSAQATTCTRRRSWRSIRLPAS